MKNILTMVAFLFSLVSISQEIKTSEIYKRTPKQDLAYLLGETEDYILIQMIGFYQTESTMMKFDHDLKLLAQGEIPVVYKPNRGAAAPTDRKELVLFNDKIIAYYSIVGKKNTADIFYDVYNPTDFSLVSEGNLLYHHAYPGTVNARDFITISTTVRESNLYFNVTIYGLINAVTAGNNTSLVIKMDQDLAKTYGLTFDQNETGWPVGYDVLQDGTLVQFFLNQTNDKLNLLTISPTGDKKISLVPTEGNYLFKESIHATEKNLLFAGLYSNAPLGDKTEPNYTGYFMYSHETGKLVFNSFDAMSKEFGLSGDSYKKSSTGYAILDNYFDENTSKVIFVINNTGKVEVAQLGIMIYDLTTNTFKAFEVPLPVGKFSKPTCSSDGENFYVTIPKDDVTKSVDVTILTIPISQPDTHSWSEKSNLEYTSFTYECDECINQYMLNYYLEKELFSISVRK